MSASYADQDNGTVLYVGKDRKKADLKQWFEALPRSCLEAIESVSMDMWPAFINATLEMVPGAVLNAIVLKVSNGPAEGINSRIKAIKVRSHGFRNKERFANAIYFHLGGLDLYPEAISQQLLPT